MSDISEPTPGAIPGTPETEQTASLLDELTGNSFGDAPPIGESPAPRPERRPLLGGRGDRGRNQPPPRTKQRETVAAQKKDEFVQPLTELYTLVGTVTFVVDQRVAETVIAQAPACAQSLNDLAAKNPEVRKALRSLTQASAMGAVVVAHAPIAVAVMASVTERRAAHPSNEQDSPNERIRPSSVATPDSGPSYSVPGDPGNDPAS